VHEIGPARVSVRHTKANGVGHAGGDAARDFGRRQRGAAPVILEGLLSRERGSTHLVELLRRAEAPVGLVRIDQALHVSLVSRQVGALIDDVLVPIEAKPIEAVENRASALVGTACLVGVLDPQK
jgi:hypothetical protein